MTQATDAFEASLANWLEQSGVTFTSFTTIPFTATIDLDKLKAAIFSLVDDYESERSS